MQRIVWVCDGKVPTCRKTACAYLGLGECDHTTDENHAQNANHHFINISGVLWEAEEKGMKIKLKKELKPCPFCGSRVREAEGIGGLLFFTCTNYDGCGAMISFDQETANQHPDKAIDMFNRRA